MPHYLKCNKDVVNKRNRLLKRITTGELRLSEDIHNQSPEHDGWYMQTNGVPAYHQQCMWYETVLVRRALRLQPITAPVHYFLHTTF